METFGNGFARAKQQEIEDLITRAEAAEASYRGILGNSEKLESRYQETAALLGNETVARMAAEERVCRLEEALRWIENIPGLTAAKARSHAAAALKKEA